MFVCLFFWYVLHRTYFIQSSKIQNTRKKTHYENLEFLFQGIATSLGIMADIFSSMNEQDYARFKTNADIDLVRFGLGFVCVDSSGGLKFTHTLPLLC